MVQKISTCQVELKPIPQPASGELSERIFRKCYFCEKNCEIYSQNSEIIQKLSGPDSFYCSFCLRNNLNNKSNKDVLILSFRSIIGYLYSYNYLQLNGNKKLWISEIEDFIEDHRKVGEENPVFFYDQDSMLWFVNFSKIGDSKRKISIDFVLKTISNILDCFNLSETIPELNENVFYQKYKSAIELFYQKRKRPEDKRMLIPTLLNSGILDTKFCNLEKMRYFTAEDLKSKK